MGKKSGTSTQVQSYQPTAEEKKLWALQGRYEEAVMPSAIRLNTKAENLLENSIGETQVNYNNLLNQAQALNNSAISGMQGLANGQIPTAYQNNINQAVTRSVNNSMGDLLQGLGSRGVLNSSVTSEGIQGINQAAANTAADMYNNDISQLSNLYGNLSNVAGSNMTLASAAQEAAQQPALNLWNASVGLDSTNLGAISALGNKGTTTTTATQPTGSIWGGVLGGIASNSSLFGSKYCLSGDTKIKTPDGDKVLKWIDPHDIILTPAGEEEVLAVMEPHIAHVYFIVTDDDTDNVLYLTDTQPMLMEDGEYKTVKELKFGEKFKGRGRITSLGDSGERRVYDIKVASGSYYANGFIAKAGTTEW